MNKPNLFKGASVSQAEFLTEFWHKRPLLLKNAIDLGDLNGLPNKSKLIQLSCKEDIQSRIVFKYSEVDYSVEFGPFIENEYDDLDQDTWNLLVSDVDKWQPQSREILKYFNFIRN